MHLADEAVFDACSYLAVRECAGSAFAEEHVGFRVENAVLPEPIDCFNAFRHRRASFEYERPVSALCELESREESCRSHAYDDRS